MTTDAPRRELPGSLVLRLARRLFSDAALATLIEPAVADLQREWSAAHGPRARFRVRTRGLAGLSAVIVLAALVPSAGAGAPLLAALLGLNGGFLIVYLVPLLLAALWPTFGPFTSGAVVAGLAFSVIVRKWNDRHPVTLAKRRSTDKDPEINLSGIPVGGDVGGFLFVVAAVLMMLGLPSLRTFVVGAMLAAVFLAYALHTWRQNHLKSPVRRIIVS
jgi:hypothetical protein